MDGPMPKPAFLAIHRSTMKNARDFVLQSSPPVPRIMGSRSQGLEDAHPREGAAKGPLQDGRRANPLSSDPRAGSPRSGRGIERALVTSCDMAGDAGPTPEIFPLSISRDSNRPRARAP